MKVKNLFAAVLLLLCMVANTAYAQLPSVKLKDINGKVIDTATLSNDGKPFIISFFATWCKPCNRELKAIIARPQLRLSSCNGCQHDSPCIRHRRQWQDSRKP